MVLLVVTTILEEYIASRLETFLWNDGNLLWLHSITIQEATADTAQGTFIK
jgi:hypothetical protein